MDLKWLRSEFISIHNRWYQHVCCDCQEYEVGSNRLVLRKIRTKSKLGKISEWKILLGEPDKKAFNPGKDLIAMSASNPVFLQQDSPTHFQWRIRNIPYDKSVYRLSIDNKRHQIVLRTTNRKYFKRIDVASIKALGLTLSDDKSVLAYTHSNNTLVITYKKPPQVIQAEMDYAQKRLRNASGGKEEPECKQQ
mmetsp:Transcript_23661/g.37224  ORF Transcript_23661/g.37224 Transcript_23661/m.37224 type:complete len:193 (-) Transcript_23661:246-824(-)